MQAHLIMKRRVCGWVQLYMSDTHRVLWSVWWKDARHSKVDLIRGIWDVFKNESRLAVTPTAVFTTSLNGQLAGRGLVGLLNTPSYIWMGGLITLSLMIHWLTHALGQCKYLWGQPFTLVCVNCRLAIFTVVPLIVITAEVYSQHKPKYLFMP